MRLVTFESDGVQRAGLVTDPETVIDLASAFPALRGKDRSTAICKCPLASSEPHAA